MSTPGLLNKQLIISTNEARKLLGQKAKNLTNEELEELIKNTETLVRLSVRSYISSKNSHLDDILDTK